MNNIKFTIGKKPNSNEFALHNLQLVKKTKSNKSALHNLPSVKQHKSNESALHNLPLVKQHKQILYYIIYHRYKTEIKSNESLS